MSTDEHPYPGPSEQESRASDTKVDGLAIETFVLYPEGEHGPSRIDLAGDEI